MTIEFHYFTDRESNMNSFYQLPKELFTNEYFKGISCEAKVLYGMMLDRISLSRKNKWIDDIGRVYIIFTVEEIMEKLNCGRNKAVNCLKELDSATGIGLIEKKRIGLGKSNIIYVKNFSFIEEADELAVMESNKKRDFDVEENKESEAEECRPSKQERSKDLHIPKVSKQTSRSLKNKLQEVPKVNANNTKYNYPELSETESNQYQSIPEQVIDKMDERTAYRKIIQDNVDYKVLCQDYNHERAEELVELMVDAVSSNKPYLRINGEDVPAKIVKSRLLKVKRKHIQYVFSCLAKNTSEVKNIRQYMLTVLYNAPATINQYYDAEMRNDLYGGDETVME
ncbi:replication initiator protein A [Lacrimispora saccharolytica]|nr:replication initiator protein A [Lacrimispora saccharolytica]